MPLFLIRSRCFLSSLCSLFFSFSFSGIVARAWRTRGGQTRRPPRAERCSAGFTARPPWTMLRPRPAEVQCCCPASCICRKLTAPLVSGTPPGSVSVTGPPEEASAAPSERCLLGRDDDSPFLSRLPPRITVNVVG